MQGVYVRHPDTLAGRFAAHERRQCPAGIIVLPCGAGKTLVGIAASVRIRKSILVLVTNSVSVDQWRHQFTYWTNLQNHQVSRSALASGTVTTGHSLEAGQALLHFGLTGCRALFSLEVGPCILSCAPLPASGGCVLRRFTSSAKEHFEGDAGVMITTYTMIAYSGRRSDESQRVMDAIASREWGLLLLDEVHVVPANMFRKVQGSPQCL